MLNKKALLLVGCVMSISSMSFGMDRLKRAFGYTTLTDKASYRFAVNTDHALQQEAKNTHEVMAKKNDGTSEQIDLLARRSQEAAAACRSNSESCARVYAALAEQSYQLFMDAGKNQANFADKLVQIKDQQVDLKVDIKAYEQSNKGRDSK